MMAIIKKEAGLSIMTRPAHHQRFFTSSNVKMKNSEQKQFTAIKVTEVMNQIVRASILITSLPRQNPLATTFLKSHALMIQDQN
ncbi:MAG TPA: hypothetical protein DF427_03810 [Moraxellaceae bacterium]|nr:hypothetical protein [Moraxellaceae bacterium]